MSKFLEALHSGRVLLMDGAMGTELQRAGIRPGECYEQWNLTHPERVQAIHQAYADAGAEVLLTNTFQANPSALSRFALQDQFHALVRSGLDLARAAAGPERFVLLDVGPMTAAGRRSTTWQLVHAAFTGGADAVLVETASGYSDTARMVKSRDRRWFTRRDSPVLMSWTFRRCRDGQPRTLHGYTPEECAACARRFAIAALGVNCGRDIGMDEVIEVVRRYRRVTDLPLFARPNAGTPASDGTYSLTPETMAARLPELLEAGACMVGGCCGTTPAHIAALRKVVDEWNARKGTL
jgi:5-methyltetrahydrofolate--homocysteine methyltransferase